MGSKVPPTSRNISLEGPGMFCIAICSITLALGGPMALLEQYPICGLGIYITAILRHPHRQQTLQVHLKGFMLLVFGWFFCLIQGDLAADKTET